MLFLLPFRCNLPCFFLIVFHNHDYKLLNIPFYLVSFLAIDLADGVLKI